MGSPVQSLQSHRVNNLAGLKRLGWSQQKEVTYVDAMLSPL